MDRSLTFRRLNLLVLLIIPVLYIYTGIIFQCEHGIYFLHSVDPEYCYFFNGLNLSQGTLKVWHVDHPGTPLQFLCAAVIRVVHFFHNEKPLLDDALVNTELYVKSISVTLFSLIGIGLFILGNIASKLFKSLFSGIFLQLIPFSAYVTLSLAFRINTEQMSILCVVILSIVLSFFLNSDTTDKRTNIKYLILFSVISGFTIAVKITFLPLFFVPFFLFKGLLNKIYYCILSFGAFTFFISPVLLYRFKYFRDWIISLFYHSGRYGEGETNIIDKNKYINALTETFSFAPFFTFSFILILAGCIIYQLPAIKRRFKNDLFYKVLLGIALAIILQILIIAKQYYTHYLTPALLISVLGLFALTKIYLEEMKILKNLILLFFISSILIIDYKQIIQYHPDNMARKEAYYKTYNFIRQNPSKETLLIIPRYYGCPYQEYALGFGLYWGGEIMKPKYIPILYKYFPNTYIYNGWDELFHDWDGVPYSYYEILKTKHSIRLFSGDEEVEKNIITHVINNFLRDKDTKINVLFSNNITQEKVYEISYNRDYALDSCGVFCDADSIDSDKKGFIGSDNQFFENGGTQTSDHSFSGKYSSKLTKDNPFGMTYIIGEVPKFSHFRITIKRYKNNQQASLVVAARNSSDYIIEEKKAIHQVNGWDELKIDFVVPEKMDRKELRIYPYNGSDSTAYFDDLKIEYLNNPPY